MAPIFPEGPPLIVRIYTPEGLVPAVTSWGASHLYPQSGPNPPFFKRLCASLNRRPAESSGSLLGIRGGPWGSLGLLMVGSHAVL